MGKTCAYFSLLLCILSLSLSLLFLSNHKDSLQQVSMGCVYTFEVHTLTLQPWSFGVVKWASARRFLCLMCHSASRNDQTNDDEPTSSLPPVPIFSTHLHRPVSHSLSLPPLLSASLIYTRSLIYILQWNSCASLSFFLVFFIPFTALVDHHCTCFIHFLRTQLQHMQFTPSII